MVVLISHYSFSNNVNGRIRLSSRTVVTLIICLCLQFNLALNLLKKKLPELACSRANSNDEFMPTPLQATHVFRPILYQFINIVNQYD